MEAPLQVAKATNRFAAIKVRTASLFSLGITARLTICIVAAAVLALAANSISRETVSIIRLVTPAPSLVAPAPTVPAGAAPAKAPAYGAIVGRKDLDILMRVIAQYDRVSQQRSAADARDDDYKGARDELRQATADYARSMPRKSADLMRQRVGDYIERAERLIEVADQLRAARADREERFDAISRRLQVSLDHGWKIFGRVIARQSLVQLRADLDAMRRNSEAPEAAKRAMAGENAFGATFTAQRIALLKSEGIDWVDGVQQDFEALVALRTTLEGLDSQYAAAADALTRQRELLTSTTAETSAFLQTIINRGAPETPPKPPASITAPLIAPAAVAAPLGSAVSGAAPPASAPLPAMTAFDQPLGDTVTETAIRSEDHKSRDFMGEVTAVVMLLICVLSILTVRSVLLPVRRMIKATAEIAAGDTQVEVARGGIRELDALADAFNTMAARLAAAQDASRHQQDILEKTVLERTHKLQQLAQQDPLTSLPNRRHLSFLLNAAIERAAGNSHYVGVYFLDIDNFKNFNDSLGHVFGDRVLMSVANRLEESVDGLGFVARLGGDEFTVVFEDAGSVAAIHELGAKLVRAFQALIRVDDRELSVSVSVGASIFPEHDLQAEGLLRAADSALFRAKELGRSRLAVFTPELIESAAARFTIEQGLRLAIERGEFELAYQPEMSLATMQMELVEALLRWRMPDGRLARPGEFLAIAEQSGLMAEINNWVLRTAVRDAARWHHGSWPDARVAINISPRQLLDHRFTEQLLAVLDEYRLPPGCIELELTETVLQTGSTTIAALRLLQSRGFGIALDDFGTGFSSLTSLEQLPLSRIKLDRSLIASIDSSARSAVIARSIIDLCAGLGLAVTAEGVERSEQLACLAANRSLFLQGYLFSEALPFEEISRVRYLLAPRLEDLILSMRPTRVAAEDAKKIVSIQRR